MIVKSQKLHKKQTEAVKLLTESDNKYFLFLLGRNTGKTSLAINIILYEVLTTKNIRLYFISQSHKFSLTIFEKIFDISKYFIKDSNKSTGNITFTNGSVITFFSFQNLDNLRGNNFADVLVLDEAAKLPNIALDSVIKQICYKPKKVLLLTTPRSKKNLVYTFINTYNPIVHKATTFDNPHIPDEEKEIIKLSAGTPLYNQETLAEFIDDGGMVFKTNELIFEQQKKSNNYFTGVDLAVEVDLTVITTINEFNQIVDIERFQKTTYEEIINRIIKHQQKLKSNLAIEKNNFGGSIIESVQKKCRVKEFITSNGSKEKIISRLQFLLAGGSLKVSNISNDIYMNLLFELDSFEYKFTNNGNIQFKAPDGLTDDMVMSLAIAILCKDNGSGQLTSSLIKNKLNVK